MCIRDRFVDHAEANVEEVIRIACQYLWLMSAFLPVLYILHVYRSTLQGMGNTVMPMISGLAEFVMRTGAAILLPSLIGYWGVFYAEVLAWAGADVILLVSYWHILDVAEMCIRDRACTSSSTARILRFSPSAR